MQDYASKVAALEERDALRVSEERKKRNYAGEHKRGSQVHAADVVQM